MLPAESGAPPVPPPCPPPPPHPPHPPHTQALKPGAATQLDAATLEEVAGDAPSASLPRASVAGAPLADVMVAIKLQPSKSAARKWVGAQGGAAG